MKKHLFTAGCFLAVGLPLLPFAASAQTNTTVTVLVRNFEYDPKDISVIMGDTILFQWESGSHPTRSDDGTTIPVFPMDNVNQSKKIVVNFGPGTVPYYCTVHGGPGGSGMAGTIAVSNPGTRIVQLKSLTQSLQTYPNPVSDKLGIRFTLKKDKPVTIKLINLLGNEVLTLLNEQKSAGEHTGTFALGQKLPAGIYFVRMATGDEVAMKRISVQ